MLAPSAPAAVPYPINRRRVTLPRYQNSSVQSFALSVTVNSSLALMGRQVPCQRPLSPGDEDPACSDRRYLVAGYFRTRGPTTRRRCRGVPIGNEPAKDEAVFGALGDDKIGNRRVSFW